MQWIDCSEQSLGSLGREIEEYLVDRNLSSGITPEEDPQLRLVACL
jgi:hypothetical protein